MNTIDFYERGGDPECEHELVFDGGRFTSHNPIWHWICAKCLRTGARLFEDRSVPHIDRKLAMDLREVAKAHLSAKADALGEGRKA